MSSYCANMASRTGRRQRGAGGSRAWGWPQGAYGTHGGIRGLRTEWGDTGMGCPGSMLEGEGAWRVAGGGTWIRSEEAPLKHLVFVMSPWEAAGADAGL